MLLKTEGRVGQPQRKLTFLVLLDEISIVTSNLPLTHIKVMVK